MKTSIYLFFTLTSFSLLSQSSNQKFDDLKFFTSPSSTTNIDKNIFQEIIFDSIIQVSEGIHTTIRLRKEIVFYSNGSIRFTRLYENNKPFGKWQYYNLNGSVKYTLHNYPAYIIVKLHYPNQNIRSQRRYRTATNTYMTGCQEEDYYRNGSVQAFGDKIPFKVANEWQLVANGKWRYFFPSGEIESIGSFKNGMKHGKWINFNTKGNKVRITKFKHGKLITQKGVS